MKKIIFLILTCLIVFALSFSKNQYFSIDEAISSKKLSKITNDQKYWLLGLSAIVMEINKCSHSTLEVKPISEKRKKIYKSVLKKWWAINNRKELIDAIKKLEKNGHNAVYIRLKDLLESNSEHSIEYTDTMSKLTPKEKNYCIFLKHIDPSINLLSIISWDLGRATSLVRWGYQVGYLTETEAWNLLLYLGRLIKTQYGAWKDYGNSYAYGRLFWASGFGATQKYYIETKETLEVLFSRNGLWNKLDWKWSLADYQWYLKWKTRHYINLARN